jgi:hypothetical protein
MNRRRANPRAPRASPRRTNVDPESGTKLTVPWMVVEPVPAPPPLPVTGNAIVYEGFTVYATPPMFRTVVLKVRFAIPLSYPKLPERDEARLPDPAVGAVWVKFKVNPVEKAAGSVPTGAVTTMSPKDDPAGVFTVFDVPLKVTNTPPLLTVLLPVERKIDPVTVEKLTGTAWAVLTPKAVMPMVIALKRALILESFIFCCA